MQRYKLRQPGFWTAAAGLVAVIGLSIASAASYLSALGWVDHTLDVRNAIDEWRTSVRAADTLSVGYLASRDRALHERFTGAVVRQHETSRRLLALVGDNPGQLAAVEATLHDANALLALRQALVGLTLSGQHELARKRALSAESAAGRQRERFEDDCDRLEARESELLLARRASARTRVLWTLTGGGALGAMAFGLLIAVRAARARNERLLVEVADQTRKRLRVLSEVAAALSEVRTTSEVAEVVVDIGMRALSADTCTLYQLNESGTALELIGSRGVAPEVLATLRTLTEHSGNPLAFETLKNGQIIWAESEDDYRKLYPDIASVKAKGPRAKAFWSVPLIVEGRGVGLLGMGFYAPRPFPSEERALVDTLGRHCAQALVRAASREREEEARRWLTTTLRSIGDAVIATDAAGLVTFMNPVASELTGWTEADAHGRPLEEVFRIISEQTRKPVESPVARVLREGAVVSLANTVLQARNGRELPIDDSGAPIRSESGRIVGVVLVFRDVSDDKADRARREFLSQAGEALVGSLDYESTLRTVVRLAVPLIADWSSLEMAEPGSAAPRQAAVFHSDPKKLELVRQLGEDYPPDPSARTGAPEVIRTGKSELYEEIPAALLDAAARDAEHLRRLRELGLCSAMVVPLRSHGRTLGAMTFAYAESNRRYSDRDLAFAEDFAHRAAMAIENSLALREVEEARAHEHRLRGDAEVASRAKDEFLALVSHELRTPLNVILGWAVMLRSPESKQNLERGLAVIERNARAQAKLIDDVLDVSRIIAGQLVLSLQPMAVADVIAAAVEAVTPAAQAKGIVIETSLPAEALVISADPQRVQQIVWNLLANAVKFTPKGGHVGLQARRDGSDVVLEVTDSGEGIRPDAIGSVFDLFQQADTSITRRHGGLGLGLAIVNQLVAAHGGTVSAQSSGPGLGSTFVVSFPVRASTPAVERSSLGEADRSPASKVIRLPRIDGLRVLLVDDEEDALAHVREVLVAHGAEVHAVGSARAALDELASSRPDVIVSDIGLPEEDGYALIRKIRSLPSSRGGRTPAVALTGYAGKEDAHRAFAAGYQIHVAKPVEPAELAAVVANLGGRSVDVN